MEPRQLDRRIEKTRRSLTSALIQLIIERGYEDLTVQDILDRAQVGRSTFYAHFRDKEALLRASVEGLRGWLERYWRAKLQEEQKPMGELAFVLPFFEHLDLARHFWRAIVGRDSGSIIDRQLRRMLADLTRTDLSAASNETGDILEARVQFTVGALMSLLEWWLDHEIKLSPQELNAVFLRLALQQR